MFDNFPDVLIGHVFDAYKKAISLAKPEDIQLLRMPYAEHLFMNFREFCTEKDITIAFHGTSSAVINSIATYGMLDPTSSMYRIKNGNVYGPGVYVSPNYNYSLGYMSIDRNIVNRNGCLLVVLAIKGSSGKSLDKGVTLDSDFSHPHSDIIVLRSTSQVLPLFVCKKIRGKTVNVDITMNGFLAELARMQSAIKLDDDILERSCMLQSANEGVKLGIIYNLFMKKIFGKKVDLDVITAEVAQMLNDFDFS
jgi:hypothetical protein